MYRIINNELLFDAFKDHSFGAVTATLTFDVHDDFFQVNSKKTVMRFEDGKPRIANGKESQATIIMDIAEFSSMVLGVIPFSRLYQYSKAEISDTAHIATADALFYSGVKPICNKRF